MYQLGNTADVMSIPSTQLHSEANGHIKAVTEETHRSSPGPSEPSDRLSLLRESPESVAEQLTKKCGYLFTLIQQEEFQNCNWEKKDKGSRAPCICDFQEHFNRTSAWVTKSILNVDITEKQRADLISHFIRIARRLLDFKNFHSFMAIVISLERQAISRLKRTWRRVEGKKNFDGLAEIISHTNSYDRLWSLMDKSDIPCIPYLGIFTKRFVELSAASDLSYGQSGQKPLKIYDRLMETLAYYQRSISLYNFKDNPRLFTSLEQQLRSCYLNEFERFFETELHRISLQIEPEETENCRTLKPTISNPLTPMGSPRKCATIPRKRDRLVISAASNKMVIDSRSTTPPELRAIGLADNRSTISNPLNNSTTTLPTDYQTCKKMGHRKIKSYGGATYRGDCEAFGAFNPVVTSLSIPKGGVSSLSPEDACSLRSTNTSTGSSDSGSVGELVDEVSDFTGECKPFMNGDRQPVSFVPGVKLKFKESSKLKISRSHKYLLKLYQNEITLSRKLSHSYPNIEKIEIPLTDLPRDVCEKFQKDKRIYLNTHKIKDIKLKPRPEDYDRVLQMLRQALSLSSHTCDSVDLIDFSHN